jgi:hypothetical protein
MSSTKADGYRKRAEECRSRAQNCDDQESWTFWLDLAQRWDQSAEKLQVLAKEAADERQAMAAEAP